ncbi:MAG: MarR family winged helix-turn-helix transcriptional regulator [Clostridium sp.]|uniref:MarR family winged helix-turn-helix transcriptional regulator n=1 Tax=Clostridium sp. TaxID=1506 RepID=UPI003F3F1053
MEKKIGRALGMDIYKARVLMRNKLQRKLKPFNITVEQWNVMNTISLKEGCNQKELAKISFKDGAAFTRILDILDKKGFIERNTSPSDRREYLVYLTKEGKEFHKKVNPLILENTRENFKGFSDEEIENLKLLIDRLLINLEE